MGRHTAPGTGKPEPDHGFWVRLAVVLIAVAVLATYVLIRGDDDPGTTTATSGDPATSTASSPPSTTPSTTAPATTTPSPSPSPTSAEKPPTLAFKVLGPSYITVRVPGGRVLVSRVFRKGEKRSFDQKRLQVVNGRPRAVRFTVNGKPRKPGPGDRPETFTVRRR